MKMTGYSHQSYNIDIESKYYLEIYKQCTVMTSDHCREYECFINLQSQAGGGCWARPLRPLPRALREESPNKNISHYNF